MTGALVGAAIGGLAFLAIGAAVARAASDQHQGVPPAEWESGALRIIRAQQPEDSS